MFRIVAAIFLMAVSAPAYSQSASQQFAACIDKNSTARDHSLVFRVFLIGLAESPELAEFVTLSDNIASVTQADIAEAIDRLLVFSCANAARAALSEDGARGLQAGIGAFVEKAMVTQLQGAGARLSELGLLDDVDEEALRSALGEQE